MSEPTYTEEDIDYGIDGGYAGIYDGVIIWVLKDGTMVNRFAGAVGYGNREQRIDEYIEQLRAAG